MVVNISAAEEEEGFIKCFCPSTRFMLTLFSLSFKQQYCGRRLPQRMMATRMCVYTGNIEAVRVETSTPEEPVWTHMSVTAVVESNNIINTNTMLLYNITTG